MSNHYVLVPSFGAQHILYDKLLLVYIAILFAALYACMLYNS